MKKWALRLRALWHPLIMPFTNTLTGINKLQLTLLLLGMFGRGKGGLRLPLAHTRRIGQSFLRFSTAAAGNRDLALGFHDQPLPALSETCVMPASQVQEVSDVRVHFTTQEEWVNGSGKLASVASDIRLDNPMDSAGKLLFRYATDLSSESSSSCPPAAPEKPTIKVAGYQGCGFFHAACSAVTRRADLELDKHVISQLDWRPWVAGNEDCTQNRHRTSPAVWIDGSFVGGCDDLVLQLATQYKAPKPLSDSALPASPASGSSLGEVRHLFVGLGKHSEVGVSAVQRAVHASIAEVRKLGFSSATLEVPAAVEGLSREQMLGVTTRVASMSNYKFNFYRAQRQMEEQQQETQEKEAKKTGEPLARIAIACDGELEEASVTRHACVSASTNWARDLNNIRGDVCNPEFVEQLARRVADASNGAISITVLKADELKEQGMHLLAAVGQAAPHQSRLVVMEYNGDKEENADKIALVGKGVTFDTGGLNLKPTGAIEGMHMDMGGAAAVLGAMSWLAQQASSSSDLPLRKNVVGVLALAENSIDSNSIQPLSILPSLDGQTVEVMNTDAEGRLCLADALTYVQTKHRPHQIVDLATLTGACVVALGEYCAGLFSSGDYLRSQIMKASESSMELFWHMPILSQHSEELKGDHSDLKSTGRDRWGGACTAAAFLKSFIKEKDVQWAHLDIAGPAMYSANRDFVPKGATGFGAATLVDLLVGTAYQATSCSTEGTCDCSPPVTKNYKRGPYRMDVSSEKIFVCRCGQSSRFPICDGTHQRVNKATGSSFSPLELHKSKASQLGYNPKMVPLCGCGHSKKMPFCCGKHKLVRPID